MSLRTSRAGLTRQSLETLLFAALIAGLVAGFATAVFHFVATEPVIQHAIDLEELQQHAHNAAAQPELVSREVQRIGLFVGYLLYGLTWGLFFGLAAWLTRRFAPGGRLGRLGGILAVAGYGLLGLLPQVKYPANPPGVGDPETIGYRQALYFGLLGLSVLGAVLATVVYQRLAILGERWRSRPRRLVAAAGLFLVYAAALFVLLPTNLDPVTMPPDLVAQFRIRSVIGVTIFWLVLGGTFSILSSRWSAPGLRRATERVETPALGV